MAMIKVNTDISVVEMQKFEIFLKETDLDTVVAIGYYQKRITNSQVNNNITYSFSDREDNEALLFIRLKYNSIDAAFLDYQRTGRNIATIMSNPGSDT